MFNVQRGSMREAALIIVMAVLASACATLGVPKLETFNEKVAAAYITVTGVRETNTALLNAGIISSDDAINVQQQADNVRAGIDIARAYSATLASVARNAQAEGRDLTDAELDQFKSLQAAADAKLQATLKVLEALQSYINQRKGGSP